MDATLSHPARRDRPTDRTHCGLHTLSVVASGRRFGVSGRAVLIAAKARRQWVCEVGLIGRSVSQIGKLSGLIVMKLFVLGANGRTGTQIVELALSRGHEVTAFVRSPQKLSPAGSLAIVRGDPQRPETIAAALPGHDAVLSAIGPHPRDALRPSTLLADCARATVEAMTASGVPRLVIVSAAVLFPAKSLYFAFFC